MATFNTRGWTHKNAKRSSKKRGVGGEKRRLLQKKVIGEVEFGILMRIKD
jgi:hypothetical protein